MKTITFKLGWINATIRKVSETCYQLSIIHPVKCVQRFASLQECYDVLIRLDNSRKQGA